MSKPKAERPEHQPEQKPVETLHIIGEPERLCGNCEHFLPRELDPARGRCRNLNSGRVQTTIKDMACRRGFYPCTKRFPLPGRLGIVKTGHEGT